MIRRILPSLLVGCAALTGGLARSQEPASRLPETLPPPTPAACPAPCVPTVEKTFHRRNVILIPEQSATTLPQLTLRPVEVCREKKTTLEIDWREEKRTCTELVLKPREIEQEVVCTTVKPETTVDPCTGKPCTVYKQVPEVQKVKITVFDAVPEEREYVVRFPCLKPVDNEVVVKQLVLDATTIPAICTRFRAADTSCEIKVQVPACPGICPPK